MEDPTNLLDSYLDAFLDNFRLVEESIIDGQGSMSKDLYKTFMTMISILLDYYIFEMDDNNEYGEHVTKISKPKKLINRVIIYSREGNLYHHRLTVLMSRLKDLGMSNVAKIIEKRYFKILRLYPTTVRERLELLDRIQRNGGNVQDLKEKVRKSQNFLLELPTIVIEAKKVRMSLTDLLT